MHAYSNTAQVYIIKIYSTLVVISKNVPCTQFQRKTQKKTK